MIGPESARHDAAAATSAKRAVVANDAPPPGGAYSQAIRWESLLFVSGQTPRDLERRNIDGPFRRQAEQTYANLEAVAKAGGSTMTDALKVTVYLRDQANVSEANDVFAEIFPEPRPARTTIVCDLPVSIEIDAVFGVRTPPK